MKKMLSVTFIIVCAFAVLLSGCADSRRTEDPESQSSGSDSDIVQEFRTAVDEGAEQNAKEEETMDRKMIIEIGGKHFTATLEDNKAADTLAEMMQEDPVTVQMSDYGGFEKVGDLGTELLTSNRQTTTQAGDIVLYQGNQIVIFYGSNSWSYTRLGRIDDLTGWEAALGDGDVTVTFALEE